MTTTQQPDAPSNNQNDPGRSNRRPLLIGGGLVAAAVAAWLAFGFFGIHTAFIDNEVSEGGPVFASGATTETEGSTEDAGADGAMEDDAMEDDAMDDDAMEDEAMEEEDGATPGEIVTLVSGSFTGESRYSVTGIADVLNDGSEQRFLRFEQFESSNGPDLEVYLRAENGDFVNLGPLKGNIGDQNYEIPPEVDLEVFNTVQIWCERFGVSFGFAELA